MIYRAICYCTLARKLQTAASIVFVQAATRDEAIDRLTHLLANIWKVPEQAVDFDNLKDTQELYSSAVGGAKSGDARYFEVGSQGGAPIYPFHDAPLFLLPPKTHRRLLNAWKNLAAMHEFRVLP